MCRIFRNFDAFKFNIRMKRGYLGLWSILVLTFLLFITASSFDSINICGLELKTSGMYDRLTQVDEVKVSGDTVQIDNDDTFKPQSVDTMAQNILFIGDSMLEGLSPRLAAYAKENGHKMNTVIWYSSTSNVWGECDTLKTFIRRFRPTYVFICLGANELFVRDIAKKRDKYVKTILSQIGDIPYLWIGPPNWKEDTGINDLIATNAKPGCFFLSNGMHFDRAKDGAHPTRSSAVQWMDSVVRWMPENCAHPIRLNIPQEKTAKPQRVVVLQPKR